MAVGMDAAGIRRRRRVGEFVPVRVIQPDLSEILELLIAGELIGAK